MSYLSSPLSVSPAQSAPFFGLTLQQPSRYSGVNIVTDCSDGLTTARIDEKMTQVANSIAEKREPLQKAFSDLKFDDPGAESEGHSELHPRVVSDIPTGAVAYASRALIELASSPNRDIFVHVTDPGVGGRKQHDRAILVTPNNGVHIGPNNGLFSSLVNHLRSQGEEPELLTIDLDKVQKFEQIRTDDPDYRTADTFHGKSVFGVVGGALAGNVPPQFFADQRPEARQEVVASPFFNELGPLDLDRLLKGEPVTVRGIEDRTMGNVQLNVHLPKSASTRLKQVDENPDAFPVFEVSNPAQPGNSLKAPLRRFFGQVKVGDGLIYPGSTMASVRGNRYNGGLLELAVNGDHAARTLGLPDPDTHALETAKSIFRETDNDFVPDASHPLQIRMLQAGDPGVWRDEAVAAPSEETTNEANLQSLGIGQAPLSRSV